ncbi:MAG: exonuclease SbcCD subunit D [Exilispira sp.]
MKIAFTADLHLKTRIDTPYRYNALDYIVKKIKKINEINNDRISYLIICGDLFDKDFQNYSDFDYFCKENEDFNFIVIPGNHDERLRSSFFSSNNIKVIDKIELVEFDGRQILFVPYNNNESLSNSIAQFLNQRPSNQNSLNQNSQEEVNYENNSILENFILVTHANYISTNYDSGLNKYEDGLYMPFSINMIKKYKIKKVILGHIHKPGEYGNGIIYYPGSPSPIDITEEGKRSFIIYDTFNDNIERVFIDSDIIYLHGEIMVYPDPDEQFDFVLRQIDRIIIDSGIDNEDLNKIILKLQIIGFTADIKNLLDNIKNYLEAKQIKLYENLNMEQLYVISENDDVRISLLEKFKKKLNQFNLNKIYIKGIKSDCNKDDILYEGLKIILGKKNN